MKKLILVAAAAVAMAGCQTTAPIYKAAEIPGGVGYASTPANQGRHTIVYTGAEKMTRAQVAEYALLRAAEFTLESGHEWFAVIESSTQKVTLVQDPEAGGLSGRGELGGGSATAGSGAPSPSSSPGVGDAQVNLGPSTGGFGGGDVPYQVLERWTPPSGFQTTILIQMGSGNEASFPGLTTEPEIYAAQDVANEIRAKMAQ